MSVSLLRLVDFKIQDTKAIPCELGCYKVSIPGGCSTPLPCMLESRILIWDSNKTSKRSWVLHRSQRPVFKNAPQELSMIKTFLKQWSLGNFDPISLFTPNYCDFGRQNRYLKMCNTLTLLGFSGLDNLVEVSLASPPHQKAKGKDAHRESCT